MRFEWNEKRAAAELLSKEHNMLRRAAMAFYEETKCPWPTAE
jgi:hypothetical protein